jgi:tRNA dimethylallyltransferase
MTASPMLAIVGPTASGKTEASLAVAEALGAEIVSIDSMQVYRGMDVGTAKATTAERARVPHHLLDVAPPSEPFSVARFQELASEAIGGIERRGRPPLLVGGSGLYFRAIVDRLTFPATSARTRALLEAEAATVGPERLHARLKAIDPIAAGRIEPANARRVVRALEVAAVTARPFSSFGAAWEHYAADGVRAAGIDLPRAVLHERIERRVDGIFPNLVRETAGLASAGFARFLTATQAIGYAEASAYLTGELSEREARRRTVARTKALARRQLAWFRRDPRIRWFPSGGERAVGLTDRVIAFLSAARERAEA